MGSSLLDRDLLSTAPLCSILDFWHSTPSNYYNKTTQGSKFNTVAYVRTYYFGIINNIDIEEVPSKSH